MKRLDFTLFKVVIAKSFELDFDVLDQVRPLVKESIKRFRPKRDDTLRVPIFTTKLGSLNGKYDIEHDCILIDENPTKPTKDIIFHELTHRRIEKECKSLKEQFMYHLMLEFADHTNETWYNYFLEYIDRQHEKIRKLYKL